MEGSKRKAGSKEKDPVETYMKAGRRGGRTSDGASALGRRRDRFSEVEKEVRRDLDIEGREIGKFKAKDFTFSVELEYDKKLKSKEKAFQQSLKYRNKR